MNENQQKIEKQTCKKENKIEIDENTRQSNELRITDQNEWQI